MLSNVMHNKKKLMILGGGPNQIDFIHAARALDCEIILCDYDEAAAGRPFADRFYLASILDHDAVLAVAQKEAIDAIFTNSEPGMYVCSRVAEQLGLPSIAYESFLTLADKRRMRDFLRELGLPCPNHVTYHAGDDATILCDQVDAIGYPVIVKPIDASGSRGVRQVLRVEDLQEAIACAMLYSKSQTVMVETYIENALGYVIGGDILVLNGQVVFWGLLNSLRDDRLNDRVPCGTSCPSWLSETQIDRVKQAIERVISALDIQAMTLNVEVFMDRAGTVFINELNPRNGGNRIPQLLQLGYGYDAMTNSIRASLGELSPSEIEMHEPRPCSTYVLHADRDGILKSVHFDEAIADNIVEIRYDRVPGDPVERFEDASKKIGIMMLTFDSVDEMTDKIHRMHEFVKIEIA